jgi:hypothetical protein
VYGMDTGAEQWAMHEYAEEGRDDADVENVGLGSHHQFQSQQVQQRQQPYETGGDGSYDDNIILTQSMVDGNRDDDDSSKLSSCTSEDEAEAGRDNSSVMSASMSNSMIDVKNKSGQSVLHISASACNVDALALLVCISLLLPRDNTRYMQYLFHAIITITITIFIY